MVSHQTKILILLCLMVTVGRFSLDSYLPSLPAITNHFHIDNSQTQLTLTIFLVGFAFSQLIYGALSDRFGRRKIILGGFSIFLCGALLCTIATSITWLLVARLITGIGAGVSSSLKRAVASDTYHSHELAKISANQSNAILVTILIAPVIGGYVQSYFGWRANFMLTFLYGAIIFYLLFRYLPDTRSQEHAPQPLKLVNIIKNYSSIIIHKPFISNVTYSTCAFTGMVVYTQLSSFLLIETLHVPAHVYGWLTTLIAGSYLAAGIIINRTSHKVEMKYLISVGIALLFISGIILMIETQYEILNVYSVVFPALIYVLGARIIIPNAMARSISPFPAVAGYASALISTIQTIGAACGSYIISQVYYPNLLPMAITFVVLAVISLTVFLSFDTRLEVETQPTESNI